jgi:hypothetical protein
MALINCSGCGGQISGVAAACPHCGHPGPGAAKKGGAGSWFVDASDIGCLIMLLVIGGFILHQTGLGKQLLEYTGYGKQLLEAGQKLTDSQRILGRWEGEGIMESLEFFSNGDLRTYKPLLTYKGKWQILPGQRLYLESEGLLWGKNNMEWKYEISDNTIFLKAPNGTLNLKFHKK